MVIDTGSDFFNQDAQALSTSVFLGFVVDPSLNIAARIRGPNVSSYPSLLPYV